MKRLLAFLCAILFVSAAALPKTDAQLAERKAELKKIEEDLSKRRKELEALKSEEKSVLNTLSLLDQNLGTTRDYLFALNANEKQAEKEIRALLTEIDFLDQNILNLQKAMSARIRALYKQGKQSEAETLYQLILQKENPETQVYQVNRLLNADKLQIEKLQNAINLRNEKKKQEAMRLQEIHELKKKKTSEEDVLKKQIEGQNNMLHALKTDQEMQKRALAEFERNQKTMLSLIRKLEEKRKKEIAEEKKRKEREEKEKAKKREEKKPPPKKETPAPAIAGKKCTPLEGAVISSYGMQEHPVLKIPVRNLGVEIRGKKGDKIKAAAKGTVALVSEIDGRGPTVILEHAGGFYSIYGHLSHTKVKEGETVSSCQELGTVGDVASLNGIKLYFQVSAGTEPLDPLQWLKSNDTL